MKESLLDHLDENIKSNLDNKISKVKEKITSKMANYAEAMKNDVTNKNFASAEEKYEVLNEIRYDFYMILILYKAGKFLLIISEKLINRYFYH